MKRTYKIKSDTQAKNETERHRKSIKRTKKEKRLGDTK